MFQARCCGESHTSGQRRKTVSGSSWWRARRVGKSVESVLLDRHRYSVERLRFHHDVGRERDDACEGTIEAAGGNQRDRPAIGMPEEERPLEVEDVQQCRQPDERFIVHVRGGVRLGTRRRSAEAVARVDDRVAPGGIRDALGEVAPEADRTERLVQEHDGRRTRPPLRRHQADDFEAGIANRDQRHNLMLY